MFLVLLFSLLAIPHAAWAQDQSDDILIVSVGESSDRYSEVATHLRGLLTNSAGFNTVDVEIIEDSNIESLADGFYDKNSEDIALRNTIADGYRHVILIPTINTTPTSTIEYSEYNGGPTNIYDDAPLDNAYFAPEVFYEGCAQFSSLILNAGSTPMIFLPANEDEDVNIFGPIMYRVANGVGMELIPGAYALAAAGAVTQAEEEYLYACTIFTQITGLNASVSTYSPTAISAGDATGLANTAETTLNSHQTTVHYNTSYENEGAVVYRSVDVTNAPFNNIVRYLYKGSSTQDWTDDALVLIINSNPATTAARRKLGTRNGVYSPGVRFWHPDDIGDQGFKFALNPNQATFMYVSGSWSGAPAQEVIDLGQENMVPFAFDWIKSFAISPAVSGTASTTDALDYHSCVELYFNYAERGWKLIPLAIGMGRLNEAIPNFVASDDALHASDPLIYMNAYMMLSSALGTQFPLPSEITADDIHRGSYTTEEINEACLIGHDLIKELAYLSETGDHVPDSDLTISTETLPEISTDVAFSYQLQATGGTGAYIWENISSSALPAGVSFSSDGTLSGMVDSSFQIQSLAFQVTDAQGAFRKVGMNLVAGIPQAVDLFISAYPEMTQAITLPIYAIDPDGLSYTYTNTANGTLSGVAPYLFYTPDPGATSDTFTYDFTYEGDVSRTATVSIEIVELTCVYEENFDSDGAATNAAIGGGWLNTSMGRGANWTEANDATYSNNGSQFDRAAILYSENTFQSNGGFQLKVYYTTSDLGDFTANRFSFGIISDDASLSTYSLELGSPFGGNTAVYSLGVSLTANGGSGGAGLQYADGTSVSRIDAAGTNQDFIVNISTPVTIRIVPDGLGGAHWSYLINDVLEASGNISVFDFSKNFHFAAYAQDNDYTKSIQSIELCALTADPYIDWASSYILTGGNVAPSADTENNGSGDGYANLLEFALGMDPTKADAGSKESAYTEEDGGDTYFVYQYERRTDYLNIGLNYTLIMTPDLVTASSVSPSSVIVGGAIDGYQTITTRYLIDDDAKFIQLRVDLE
ncbi:MAG: hypothetical protein ACSHX0_02560 [Akkermansiaceae bacterium]